MEKLVWNHGNLDVVLSCSFMFSPLFSVQILTQECWCCAFQFHIVNFDQTLWPVWRSESSVWRCGRVSQALQVSLECASLHLPNVYMYMERWSPNGLRCVPDHATRWLPRGWENFWYVTHGLLEAPGCPQGFASGKRGCRIRRFGESRDVGISRAHGARVWSGAWPKLPSTVEEVTWPFAILEILELKARVFRGFGSEDHIMHFRDRFLLRWRSKDRAS